MEGLQLLRKLPLGPLRVLGGLHFIGLLESTVDNALHALLQLCSNPLLLGFEVLEFLLFLLRGWFILQSGVFLQFVGG